MTLHHTYIAASTYIIHVTATSKDNEVSREVTQSVAIKAASLQGGILSIGGTTASDTFETGTAAAAWGGTTTIIDFAIQTPGEAVPECLDRWHAKAAGEGVQRREER